MKRYFLKSIILIVLAMTFSAVEAQFVVRVKPAAPLIRVRPMAPSPRHIWVNGEYVWRSGQYVYVDGYWATPPHPGYRRVDGHWKFKRRGWVWVRGHWR